MLRIRRIMRAFYALAMFLGMVSLFLLSDQENAFAIYSANEVPVMTSDTSPSGEASASSWYTWGTTYASNPYKAFDHVDPTAPVVANTIGYSWVTATGSTTGWLAYDFKAPKVITKYTLVCNQYYVEGSYDGRLRAPKSWTFEAWDPSLNGGIGDWVILQTMTNVTGWEFGEWKTFFVNNDKAYSKYRINISENNGDPSFVSIGEMEIMKGQAITLGGNANDWHVDLNWTPVEGATEYLIKRATTPNGPYTVVNSVYAPTTSYCDNSISSGQTYYYVVSALNTYSESADSNEITIQSQSTNRALLIIQMTDVEKEYDLPMYMVNDFISWYDLRLKGIGSSHYSFNNDSNVGPFINLRNNIIFEKIIRFEVMEY